MASSPGYLLGGFSWTRDPRGLPLPRRDGSVWNHCWHYSTRGRAGPTTQFKLLGFLCVAHQAVPLGRLNLNRAGSLMCMPCTVTAHSSTL